MQEGITVKSYMEQTDEEFGVRNVDAENGDWVATFRELEPPV